MQRKHFNLLEKPQETNSLDATQNKTLARERKWFQATPATN